MSKIIITADCSASENGVDVIEFEKGQIVDVSEPMKVILVSGIKKAKAYTAADAKKAADKDAKAVKAEKEAAIVQAKKEVELAEEVLAATPDDGVLVDNLAAAKTALEALSK